MRHLEVGGRERRVVHVQAHGEVADVRARLAGRDRVDVLDLAEGVAQARPQAGERALTELLLDLARRVERVALVRIREQDHGLVVARELVAALASPAVDRRRV